MLIFSSLVLLTRLARPAFGIPAGRHSFARGNEPAPQVGLDYGTFQGFSANSTDSFLGIPFAQPPTGDLRFRLPQPPKQIPGVYNATSYGDACPQQAIFGPNTVLPNITGLPLQMIGEEIALTGANASEDCLSINIIRPTSLPNDAKLPVLVWIYGGAFMIGASSSPTLNGVPIVERSIALGQPVIFVSMNYRLNAFGFLGGKEVKEAGVGNLGLQDQRFALQWVQKYVGSFGGDPSKVVLWGESAGSLSVVAQMSAAEGQADGLFRGAVLESGFPAPINDITEGQSVYDQLVAETNCSSSSSTLDCLRAVPYNDLMKAVNNTPSFMSYASLNLTWTPRVDGVFLKKTLRQSFSEGLYTKMPIIAGDCDDEGTLFSLFSTNVTTNQGFADYLQTILPGANSTQVALVQQAYPEDPSQGSPFGTGTNSSITPEFKRISALVGDAEYQAPRRLMLKSVAETQNAWAFLYKRGKGTPYLGAYHSSDLPEFFASGTSPDYIGTDALVNFAYRLNPNALPSNSTVQSGLKNITWPQWNNSTGAPSILAFEDPDNVTITYDIYRAQAMDLLNEIETQLSL